jgi:hypothetical protein
MKKEKTTKKYHPYQVPEHIYQKLEHMAKERRQKTGANVSWSVVLRDTLEKSLTN